MVAVDFTEIGRIHAQWLADTLGGKGNVVINRGVSGFPADANMNAGMTGVLAKYPDIKVVGEVYGKWDNAVSQQELTKVLTANPAGRRNPQPVQHLRGTAGAAQPQPSARSRCRVRARMRWRIAMLDYKDKGLKGVSAGDRRSSARMR